MKRLALGIVGLLVLTWTAARGWDQLVDAHRIVAGAENESPLYRSYDPEPVLKRFRNEHENYGSGHGNGATQLVKSIHHNEEFRPNFTMQASQELELSNALRDDIMLRLKSNGMAVVGTHDEANGGFTFVYTSGNSVGSISVQPPVHQTTVRRYPVPSGMDDVRLRIDLDETWTRPASETRWWMAAVD